MVIFIFLQDKITAMYLSRFVWIPYRLDMFCDVKLSLSFSRSVEHDGKLW